MLNKCKIINVNNDDFITSDLNMLLRFGYSSDMVIKNTNYYFKKKVAYSLVYLKALVTKIVLTY